MNVDVPAATANSTRGIISTRNHRSAVLKSRLRKRLWSDIRQIAVRMANRRVVRLRQPGALDGDRCGAASSGTHRTRIVDRNALVRNVRDRESSFEVRILVLDGGDFFVLIRNRGDVVLNLAAHFGKWASDRENVIASLIHRHRLTGKMGLDRLKTIL